MEDVKSFIMFWVRGIAFLLFFAMAYTIISFFYNYTTNSIKAASLKAGSDVVEVTAHHITLFNNGTYKGQCMGYSTDDGKAVMVVAKSSDCYRVTPELKNWKAHTTKGEVDGKWFLTSIGFFIFAVAVFSALPYFCIPTMGLRLVAVAITAVVCGIIVSFMTVVDYARVKSPHPSWEYNSGSISAVVTTNQYLYNRSTRKAYIWDVSGVSSVNPSILKETKALENFRH